MTVTRVLIVDDDAALARALGINLRARGFEVQIATSGTSALDAVARFSPQVVVLDLGLPDLDGIDVLLGIRGWNDVPVLVLSARQTSAEKVQALDAGADDYITKPFEMSELMARIRAAVRRGSLRPATDQQPAEIVIGDVCINLAKGIVTRRGEKVRLTPTEYHLLEVLTRNLDRLVPHAQLLREVWGAPYENEAHYLRVYVAQLRRKLERDPARPTLIRTEPGLGYVLSSVGETGH